jgi:hypothetical protein
MNILGIKTWMWINGITLIIVGALSLVPETWAIISYGDGVPLSVIKIIVAVITLTAAFKETDAEMINGKIWLVAIALVLLFMGVLPLVPGSMAAMGGAPTGDFLNTMKVVLGVLTFLVIIIDWSKLGP